MPLVPQSLWSCREYHCPVRNAYTELEVLPQASLALYHSLDWGLQTGEAMVAFGLETGGGFQMLACSPTPLQPSCAEATESHVTALPNSFTYKHPSKTQTSTGT